MSLIDVGGDAGEAIVGNSGVAMPVSGTVTANLSATDNGVLDTIAASLAGTLTVDGSGVTQPVSNGGTFVVQINGDALTAFELLDDAVYTDGTGTPSKGLAVMGSDGTNPRFLTVDSSGHAQVDVLSSALPTGAATSANQTTLIGHVDGIESSLSDAVTALQVMDDWDETNRCKVNLIVGQAGVSAGSGAVDATTQRVILATDDPAVALLTTIDVDSGNIATAASAIQTSVQLLDDAVYTSGSGTPSKGLAVMGTDGTNPRIISVDTSGHQQIDVLSSALPTGAATSANQSTANTALAAIQTALQILDNAISGNEMQVDIVTSALPTGAATSANQSTANTALSAIQTAVQLIDNAISGSEMQVDVVAALPAGTNTIGVVINERVSTATLSNVSGSATSVQLLASTAGRKGASFWNDSTAVAYVKMGTTASTTSATLLILPGGFYELPQPIYTGRIDCIWAAANGAMRITEYT